VDQQCGAVVYVGSLNDSYVNGQELVADGGTTVI